MEASEPESPQRGLLKSFSVVDRESFEGAFFGVAG